MEGVHSFYIRHIQLVPTVAIVSAAGFDEMEREWITEIVDFFFSVTEIVFEGVGITHIFSSTGIISELAIIAK
jgi:hypothetical protein